MADYSANAVQTVNPGEAIVFTTDVFPCKRGFIRHRNETGNFLLNGWLPNRYANGCCCNSSSAQYLVNFGANIAVPTGGTAGEISVAISVDGAIVPASTMAVTPAAVEEFFNVGRSITVPVWRNCCETVTIQNTSDQPILVRNAYIAFTRPDLEVTY